MKKEILEQCENKKGFLMEIYRSQRSNWITHFLSFSRKKREDRSSVGVRHSRQNWFYFTILLCFVCWIFTKNLLKVKIAECYSEKEKNSTKICRKKCAKNERKTKKCIFFQITQNFLFMLLFCVIYNIFVFSSIFLSTQLVVFYF